MAGKAGVYFWLSAFLIVMLVHGVWLSLNQASPVWDMAHHQWMGLRTLHALRDGTTIRQLVTLSDYYPPLYYFQEAFVMGLLGRTRYLPLLSNLLGLALLSGCTYRLANGWMRSPLPEAAGILSLLLPMVAWTSRSSLLDVPLSGWVAASVLLLVRSRWLHDKKMALLFGLSVAAGMLTKWTHPLFVAPIVLFALSQAADKQRSLRNLLDAFLAALPLILLWYLPNLGSLMERLRQTSQAAVAGGDPGLLDWLAWIYYPRALSSYYLFLPLTVLLAVGAVRAWNRAKTEDAVLSRLLAVWLVGSLLLLTLVDAKDPRYVLPLAGPTAILVVWVWRHSVGAVLSILALAFFQFLAVSFGTPAGELRIAWSPPSPPYDYRSTNREWVFFQTGYSGTLGPPTQEDWRMDALLKALPDGAEVGFLPEMPRFHCSGLQLEAQWRGREVQVVRIGQDPDSLKSLPFLDFAVTKTGRQGIPHRTAHNRQATEDIQHRGWGLVLQIGLPDGSVARLWRNSMPVSRDTVNPDYALLRIRLQNLVHDLLPPGAKTLVVCKGDDRLIELLGPDYSHFPQSQTGGYLGYHPTDSEEAIAHLVRLQSQGAEYILFPQTSLWWLDYYSGLKEHLETNGEQIYLSQGLGAVYRLGNG